MDIKQKIISLSQQAGACSIGFADIVEVSTKWKESFDSMIGEGRHGSMAFMERNRELRQNPALLLEGAKTIISLAFSYDKGVRHPRIASYALVPDYHYYLRELLGPITSFLQEELGAQCRICVDSAPMAERFWALRTGVGVRGRNQQLMVPGVGARVFLAEILTTARIEPDPIVTYEGYADVCIGCDRCVRACPNGALEDPERFDARGCVSYLTIEHRGDLPEGISLAGKIYGCDICLDACPYNHNDIVVDEDGDNIGSLTTKETQKISEKDTYYNTSSNPSHSKTAHYNNATHQSLSPETQEPIRLSSQKSTVKRIPLPPEEPIEPQREQHTQQQSKGNPKDFARQTDQEHISEIFSEPHSTIPSEGNELTNIGRMPQSTNKNEKGDTPIESTPNKRNFYGLQRKADSPFEIDTDILSLSAQDIENMTSGQFRRLTKKSAMSRCSLSQLRRNL